MSPVSCCAVVVTAAFLLTGRSFAAPTVAAQPMPLISRGVPTFASKSLYPASRANDGDYNTEWRSSGTISAVSPAWLAYDLSSVPAAKRDRVVVAWYGNSTYNYDYTYFHEAAHNLPADYVLETHAAKGGGSPPSAGWVTLATVSSNTYHSRQHIVDLSRRDWLRMRITGIAGTQQNFDAAINLDVHHAPQGADDSWIFFGDSITAATMTHSGGKNFSTLVNDANPAFFPVAEVAGLGGAKTDDAVKSIERWLAVFPGKYVCLSYGTNDVNGNFAGVESTYQNYVTLVQKVIAVGKVPCIPHIPWAPAAGLQKSGPALNAKLDQLYREFPQVVRGPDLWDVFRNRKDLFRDDLHPNDAGVAVYRRAFAETMRAAVYP